MSVSDEEDSHISVILLDSHRGFYFPPSAIKDRAGMDGCSRIQKMPSGLYADGTFRKDFLSRNKMDMRRIIYSLIISRQAIP